MEEKFIRGGGPGGQSINKTESCVVLVHKPTGIWVKCQESRSQYRNRQIARQRLKYVCFCGEAERMAKYSLREKIDLYYLGEVSKVAQKASILVSPMFYGYLRVFLRLQRYGREKPTVERKLLKSTSLKRNKVTKIP